MKKIINLIFDRIERVLWFRHLLWTLRKHGNYPMLDKYDVTTNQPKLKADDTIDKDAIRWLHKHRNDYFTGENGKATGTENSTDVTEDKS